MHRALVAMTRDVPYHITHKIIKEEISTSLLKYRIICLKKLRRPTRGQNLTSLELIRVHLPIA